MIPDETDDLLPDCPPGMMASKPTYYDLQLALDKISRLERRIAELEAENNALHGPVRPSLEVLQRMANGLDPFDPGRFKCAVAALPHETPKLSASVVGIGHAHNWGDQLDDAKARRARLEEEMRRRSHLRVIDAEPA